MTGRVVAALVQALTGCRPKWAVLPPLDQPCVFFGNHTSHLDSLVIWAALPEPLRRRCRLCAARDYWEATPRRRWLAQRVFHALLIERRVVTRQNNPLTTMLAALDRAEVLVLFPEGGRQESDASAPFKSGLFHVARRRPDVPLFPVCLQNLNRILPKGAYLPVPIIGSVYFGEPLTRSPGENKSAFLERARLALETLRGS